MKLKTIFTLFTASIITTGCSLIENKNDVEVVESKPSFVRETYTLIGKTKTEVKKEALSICDKLQVITPIRYDNEKKIYTYTIECIQKNFKEEQTLIMEEIF